ncbi:DUF5937 family protein [Planomonospora alba]|uniref:DUF5937 family protein n=1 Tax=Planomonospora alba TaxID=161354 RepID=A0ABP6NK02_9ACTN
MAVTITLSRAEVGRVRFAASPLAETVFAVKLLLRDGANAVHHRWARRARTALAGDPDLPFLAAMISGCVPAFLLPPPDGPAPGFAEELERVRGAPHDYVHAELDGVFGTGRRPAPHADPAAVLERSARALERYHDRLIAPHWGRMRAILLADLEHRARALAERGVEGLFSALHEDITWREGDLVVDGRRTPGSFTVDLGGHGLVLFPTIFCWPYICIDMAPLAAGSLRYPARGLGTLWEPAEPVPDGLAAVLGRTKAALLEALAEPCPTGELARRLGITASAVSQHMSALRQAGLVTTRRDGRTALHLRTERGTRLTRP